MPVDQALQSPDKHDDSGDDVAEWADRRRWLRQSLAGQEYALAPLRGTDHNAGPKTPQANWRALLRHLVRDTASGTERRRLDDDSV
jgi:hypothetical protein